MTLLQILFWGWCATAVVWLGIRRIRSIKANRSVRASTVDNDVPAERDTLDRAAPPALDALLLSQPNNPMNLPHRPPPSYVPPPEWAVDPIQPVEPAAMADGDHLQPQAPMAAPPTPSMPTPSLPVPPSRVEEHYAAPPTPHLEPISSIADLPRVHLKSLSEIMHGIRMPCDLAPLLGDTSLTSHGNRRAAFLTTTYQPNEVGSALADELERLGMSLQSISDNQAIATRGADSVMLTIHRSAELFPTAPDSAVVVEIDIV